MKKGKGEFMKKIAMLAHDILKDYIHEDSICADFTMGQGNDTLFLANVAPIGKVYAFDIQQAALDQTRRKLEEGRSAHVELILDSHEALCTYIKEPLDVGIFNLGYLPNGDLSITTMCDQSMRAIQLAFGKLKRHGMLVLVLYVGHDEGKKEAEQIIAWCEQLPLNLAIVMKVSMLQKPLAPILLAIEKIGDEEHDKSSDI